MGEEGELGLGVTADVALLKSPVLLAGWVEGWPGASGESRGPLSREHRQRSQLESKANLVRSSSISSISRLMVRVTSLPRSPP